MRCIKKQNPTELACVNLRPDGAWSIDNIKRLITLTAVAVSGNRSISLITLFAQLPLVYGKHSVIFLKSFDYA